MTADYFIDSSEFYYRSYSERLCGELTDEKDIYLEEERERFAAQETEQERYLARYNRGEIGQVELDYYLGRLEEDAAPQNSFERAYEHFPHTLPYRPCFVNINWFMRECFLNQRIYDMIK